MCLVLRMNEGIHPSPQPPPTAALLTASFLEPRIQPGTVPDPCSARDTCCQSAPGPAPPISCHSATPSPAHVLSLSPRPCPAHVL